VANESYALSLDAIVRDVAEQLHRLRDHPPADPVIAFKGCEIELSVKATVQAGGGIRFYVFTAEAKASQEQVSKIKLSFGTAGLPLVLQAQTPGDQGRIERQSSEA
jgi:hypothetical protein